jgi:hypothetical protein
VDHGQKSRERASMWRDSEGFLYDKDSKPIVQAAMHDCGQLTIFMLSLARCESMKHYTRGESGFPFIKYLSGIKVAVLCTLCVTMAFFPCPRQALCFQPRPVLQCTMGNLGTTYVLRTAD